MHVCCSIYLANTHTQISTRKIAACEKWATSLFPEITLFLKLKQSCYFSCLSVIVTWNWHWIKSKLIRALQKLGSIFFFFFTRVAYVYIYIPKHTHIYSMLYKIHSQMFKGIIFFLPSPLPLCSLSCSWHLLLFHISTAYSYLALRSWIRSLQVRYTNS